MSRLPDEAVVSRRFGSRQNSGDASKARPIDDFSTSGANDSVQVENATKLHTSDIAAALRLELSGVPGNNAWLGKTFGLASAYLHLEVAPGSCWVPYTAVDDPIKSSPRIFARRALPFGASRSFCGFLREAHSLGWLGWKGEFEIGLE